MALPRIGRKSSSQRSESPADFSIPPSISLMPLLPNAALNAVRQAIHLGQAFTPQPEARSDLAPPDRKITPDRRTTPSRAPTPSKSPLFSIAETRSRSRTNETQLDAVSISTKVSPDMSPLILPPTRETAHNRTRSSPGGVVPGKTLQRSPGVSPPKRTLPSLPSLAPARKLRGEESFSSVEIKISFADPESKHDTERRPSASPPKRSSPSLPEVPQILPTAQRKARPRKLRSLASSYSSTGTQATDAESVVRHNTELKVAEDRRPSASPPKRISPLVTALPSPALPLAAPILPPLPAPAQTQTLQPPASQSTVETKTTVDSETKYETGLKPLSRTEKTKKCREIWISNLSPLSHRLNLESLICDALNMQSSEITVISSGLAQIPSILCGMVAMDHIKAQLEIDTSREFQTKPLLPITLTAKHLIGMDDIEEKEKKGIPLDEIVINAKKKAKEAEKTVVDRIAIYGLYLEQYNEQYDIPCEWGLVTDKQGKEEKKRTDCASVSKFKNKEKAPKLNPRLGSRCDAQHARAHIKSCPDEEREVTKDKRHCKIYSWEIIQRNPLYLESREEFKKMVGHGGKFKEEYDTVIKNVALKRVKGLLQQLYKDKQHPDIISRLLEKYLKRDPKRENVKIKISNEEEVIDYLIEQDCYRLLDIHIHYTRQLFELEFPMFIFRGKIAVIKFKNGQISEAWYPIGDPREAVYDLFALSREIVWTCAPGSEQCFDIRNSMPLLPPHQDGPKDEVQLSPPVLPTDILRITRPSRMCVSLEKAKVEKYLRKLEQHSTPISPASPEERANIQKAKSESEETIKKLEKLLQQPLATEIPSSATFRATTYIPLAVSGTFSDRAAQQDSPQTQTEYKASLQSNPPKKLSKAEQIRRWRYGNRPHSQTPLMHGTLFHYKSDDGNRLPVGEVYIEEPSEYICPPSLSGANS